MNKVNSVERRVRRKPTNGDLIALINHAAHEAGGALSIYHNDRQPDRAGELARKLKSLQSLLLDAAGHFPPPKRSEWTDQPNAGNERARSGPLD